MIHPMVRPARIDDADAIAVLSGQLGYSATAEQVTHRLTRVLPREDMITLVADVDGAVVGWIHLFGCERLESEPSAEIGGIVVADGHRGAGIGAQLIAAGESWAIKRGYALVRVRSNIMREDAHRFYERSGYAREKRQAVFTKVLTNPHL